MYICVPVVIDSATDTVDSVLVVTWNFPLNIRNQSCLKFFTFSVAVKCVSFTILLHLYGRSTSANGAGLTAFGKKYEPHSWQAVIIHFTRAVMAGVVLQ